MWKKQTHQFCSLCKYCIPSAPLMLHQICLLEDISTFINSFILASMLRQFSWISCSFLAGGVHTKQTRIQMVKTTRRRRRQSKMISGSHSGHQTSSLVLVASVGRLLIVSVIISFAVEATLLLFFIMLQRLSWLL